MSFCLSQYLVKSRASGDLSARHAADGYGTLCSPLRVLAEVAHRASAYYQKDRWRPTHMCCAVPRAPGAIRL